MPVFFFSLLPPLSTLFCGNRETSAQVGERGAASLPRPRGDGEQCLRCGASQGQCGSPQLSHDGTPGCEHRRWAQAPAVPPLCFQPSLAPNREGWRGRVLFCFLAHMSHARFFGSIRISGVRSPLCTAKLCQGAAVSLGLRVLPAPQKPSALFTVPELAPVRSGCVRSPLLNVKSQKKRKTAWVFPPSSLLVLLPLWWHPLLQLPCPGGGGSLVLFPLLLLLLALWPVHGLHLALSCHAAAFLPLGGPSLFSGVFPGLSAAFYFLFFVGVGCR